MRGVASGFITQDASGRTLGKMAWAHSMHGTSARITVDTEPSSLTAAQARARRAPIPTVTLRPWSHQRPRRVRGPQAFCCPPVHYNSPCPKGSLGQLPCSVSSDFRERLGRFVKIHPRHRRPAQCSRRPSPSCSFSASVGPALLPVVTQAPQVPF